MEIITGYTGKKHVTAEQDRDINIGIIGGGSYVIRTGMQMEAEVSTNNEIKIRDGVVMHQGCAASIKKNTYDSVNIISGSQGMKRIDRIVARYQRDKNTNVESLDLIAIQGNPVESDPEAPEYVTGDIQAGDYMADMPMYQVVIDGLNIVEVKKEFETAIDLEVAKRQLTELNGNLETLNGANSAIGSALVFKEIPSGQNPTYGAYSTGLYVYGGYSTGAPDDWAGVILSLRIPAGTMKYAFTFGGQIYFMRHNTDGTVSLPWTLV